MNRSISALASVSALFLLPACADNAAQQPESYHLDFSNGSAAIDPNAHNTLAEVGEVASRNPSANVTVVGRADSSGSLSYNRGLARQRAMAVRDALVAAGDVTPERIQTLWVSEKELQTGQPAPGARAVDIYLQ